MRRALVLIACALALPGAAATAHAALPSGRTTYRTLDDVRADLRRLVAAHPGLARAVSLPGASVQGRPIEGVEIAAGVDGADGRPTVLHVGLVHAREWPSEELLVEHAIDLAGRAASDERVARLLRRVRVVIVPVLNPDGLVATQSVPATSGDPQAGTGAYKRKNCSGASDGGCGPGADLNRNAGAFWGGPGAGDDAASLTYRGAAPFSEPETQAFRAFASSRQLMLVHAVHNYLGAVLHQPGFCGADEPGLPAGTPLPGAQRMADVARSLAAAAGYESGPSCRLYDATGALEDWTTYAQGGLGLTTEIAGSEFHGAYEQSVAAQWPGMRELLLRADEAGADPAGYAAVTGTAPAGRVLRLARDVTTSTSYVLTNTASDPVAGAAQTFPDHFEATLTVPASGAFEWAVLPSTRPLTALAGGTEAWTLTCEDPAGAVLERRALVTGAGGSARADLTCGAAAGPPPAAAAVSSLAIRSVRRSGRRLTVRLAIRGGPVRRLRVTLRQRPHGRLRASARRSTAPGRLRLRARRLPPGRYVLRATARTPAGATLTATRTLRVRAPRR